MKSIDLYFHSLDKYMKGLFLTHYTIVFRKSGDSIINQLISIFHDIY